MLSVRYRLRPTWWAGPGRLTSLNRRIKRDEPLLLHSGRQILAPELPDRNPDQDKYIQGNDDGCQVRLKQQ